jgi:hypothetical protein
MSGRRGSNRRGDGRCLAAGIAWDPSGQAAPPACCGLLPPPSWPLPMRFLLAVGRAARGGCGRGRGGVTDDRCGKLDVEVRGG